MNDPHVTNNPPPQPPRPPVMYANSAARDPRAKSPGLASLLSAIPGLGQVYVGYYQRGFTHALVVAGCLTLLAIDDHAPILPFVPLFMVFFWLYNIIDAGRRATYFNQVLAGGEIPEVPEDFKMPGMRGSILGGVLLIAGGSILLSRTRFGYSLDWIEEWWPLAPIGLGLYLLVKALQERAAVVKR